MRFGAHVSIADNLADSVDRAVSIGCDAMQIFPGNPRGWRPGFFRDDQVSMFRSRRKRSGVYPLAIHLPYLINLGSPNERVSRASADSILDSLAKAKSVEADFLVMHTGSHAGAGYETGLERIKSGLIEILNHDFGATRLLLENTSGAGYTIGARLEEIVDIMASTGFDERLGLCLDTCHAYAAGYDIADRDGLNSFMDQIDRQIGRDRLLLVHANDCRSGLGSRTDRHEHIGKGSIGLDGFRNILAHPDLLDMTFIIETPRPRPGDDQKNLNTLKDLAAAARKSPI